MAMPWEITVDDVSPGLGFEGKYVYAKTIGPYPGQMIVCAFSPDEADALAARLIDAAREARTP